MLTVNIPPPPSPPFLCFMLQSFPHPRIPETVSAIAAEGCESVSPASCGCAAAHSQRPAVIHPRVLADGLPRALFAPIQEGLVIHMRQINLKIHTIGHADSKDSRNRLAPSFL